MVDICPFKAQERMNDVCKNKYPDSKVIIKGYASPEGSVEVNARIAAARAEAVKTILVNKYKINASRITETFKLENTNKKGCPRFPEQPLLFSFYTSVLIFNSTYTYAVPIRFGKHVT